MDPGRYGTDGTDPEEATGVLEPEDTLEQLGVRDVLDVGWSPAERAWAVDDWGTTEREEATGEGLDGRLARELPDLRWTDDGDGLGDVSDTDGELRDDEVGDVRAGRLVAAGGDAGEDVEPELYALDAGIDSAAASAEEAAVHVVATREDAGEGDRPG
ncbi:hypothetical protein SAMN05660690_3939 [Geodermatophilus telluris]|uniref:DUF5709 domain-containing protein n=1 Tax=Geodermatophilus telluris TaxID=1190417 RepID=A0A1G6TM39_9ACTN|nr:DUF5709 domain-containing protein [Geodermatophilus telluris]SDD30262.1 hypothetical protein SAMN05660690_3939 [Geodermatophilus telluris]